MVDFMNFENYSCDNQMSIFDFIEDGTKNEFNPLESLALHGTGFVGGMNRVRDYFSMKPHSMKEKADFLKNEYGVGGFGSPIKKPRYVHYGNTCTSGKDIVFEYYDENMQNVEDSCSWIQLAKVISEMVRNGKY